MPGKARKHYVYVLVSQKGTIYTGDISKLHLAVQRHRTKEMPGRYDAKKLVYYETLNSLYAARTRAREIKRWT